jgi:hypothetical protein
VYPLKNYKSAFLEEKSFGSEDPKSKWKKMYDNFIQERPTETTKRGIIKVYGILKYSATFLQFY